MTPELWQMLFNPSSISKFDLPVFVQALLLHVRQEAERVYWNVNQEQLDLESYNWEEEKEFAFRTYDWNFALNDDEDSSEEQKANIEFENVKIYFYKHFGRGMTCNVSLSEIEWIEWFTRFEESLVKFEKRNSKHFC